MKQRLLQLKFEMRALLAREPLLAWPNWLVVWWTQQKMRGHIDLRECRVGPYTEFVLDGFQGSGNSFATVAFKRSQTRPVLIAHHLHSPAQVIQAVRRGLPTLVTIREPADAVLSLTSRWPYVSAQQALRSYARYYAKIAPYAGGFVLSPFDQTTRHLDRVIQEVNRRYHTCFDLFEPSEENMRALRDPAKLASADERKRRDLKAQKAGELETPACQALLAEAKAVYQSLERFGVGR